MLPKAHLTLRCRIYSSRWVTTPLWLMSSWRSFLYSSVCSCHRLLISSTSVRSILFLSFIVLIFAWKVPLVSLNFLKRSLVFPILFSSVQLLSRVWLFVTPWTTARQASLSINNSQSLFKLMPIESVMPLNLLILCRPLLLLPSIIPSIRVFSNESTCRMRCPKYWSFSFSISPSNEYQEWFPLGWTGWISLQFKGLSRVFSNTTVQKHQFFHTQPFYSPTLMSIRDY